MRRFLALMLLSASPAAAHEFWIEPSTFRPEPERKVEFFLRAGELGKAEPVPRRESRIERFELVGARGVTPIRGAEGRDPAGEATTSGEGPWVAVLRSRPLSITLDPAKFEAYLREEGLEHVIAARAAKGQTRVDGREIYSRCAKALLGTGADRVLGLRLELVAEKDPAALGADRSLPVRLEFEGKPLAGALVLARSKGAGDRPLRGRTDTEGRVIFQLDGAGPWLVSSVHMVPAPDGVDSDWESLWASLTFRASDPE
jgi:uncharacterized GH25 family protein